MRVSAIGRMAVGSGQLADELHALARRSRPIQHDARKIAGVRSALAGRGHGDQLGPGRRPYVAYGDTVLVQAAIGQRCRDSPEVAIADPDLPRRLRDLWYLG